MLINPECLVGVALLQVLADILSVELPVKPTPGLWSAVSVSSRDIFSIAQSLHLNILPLLCNVSVILKIHNLASVYCTEIPPPHIPRSRLFLFCLHRYEPRRVPPPTHIKLY